MNIRLLRYILCLLAIIYPKASFALNELNDSVVLDEVVVIANRYSEVIPSQRLAGEELRNMNSLSVADALRYFSGIQLKDYGGVGGLKTVNIRSMGTNHMGVYYNGIQLGNAQNGQVDLGKYSLDNIGEISVYNGQKSEIFQTAREFGSAGSIYISSKFPVFKDGEKSNFRASIKAGSFDLFNAALTFEYKINKDLNFTFNSEWINASGKYKFRYRRVRPDGELAYDTIAIRQNGDIDALRFEGSVNGYIPKGKWKVHLYHYSSERGVPGAIVNNVWRNGERLWDRNTFLQGLYEQDISDMWSAKVNVKYANDFTHYVNNDDKLIHVDNKYKQKEVYASLANKLSPCGWLDLSAAYDFQWNGLSEYMRESRLTHWISLASSATIADRFKILISGLATIVNEENRERDDVPTKKKITPAIFLSYQPIKKINLVARAFYKQSFRYPTFNDLYYTDMGNAYLRPECATQYNCGLTYSEARDKGIFSYFNIGVDIYYNDVKDKIIAYPKGQQFRWTMLNLGRVDIRGIDVSAMSIFSLPANLDLTTKLQYTYQKAIDVTDPADNYFRHQIPYIPHHSGSVIAMLSWKGCHLNYSWIYVGERYNQQENIRYNYTQPWYTSDVSISKDFTLLNCSMRATVEVNNLLSQDYDVILNYPMPKRNFRFGLSIEL